MICVAIGNKTIKENLKDAKKAIKLGANLLEIRLDYLKDLSNQTRINSQEFLNLQIPIIFTLRMKSEGGKGNFNENFRLNFIEKLIDLKPNYIDLEFSIEKQKLSSLIDKCHESGVKIILSYHNFEKTDSIEQLINLVNEMMSYHCDVIKVITMAKEKEDNFIAFKLLEFINSKKFKSLVFCMGKNGLISRIMGPYLGNFFTFASIGAATAPGQLSITDLKAIYEIIDKHKI